MLDFLIVGQGLAGSLLSYFLIKQDQSFFILDNEHQEAASTVAAGLINPITGRRIVKSWMFDDLFHIAQQTYSELEKLLQTSIYTPRHLLWAFHTVKDENEWYSRAGIPAFAQYIQSPTEAQQATKITKNNIGFGEICCAAQIDLPVLIQQYKQFLIKKNYFRSEKFDFQALQLYDNHIQYKDIQAQKIIFCEGHQARFNPFFNNLPFSVAKGEILVIQLDEPLTKIVKQGITIIPLPAPQHYWVGATYEWNPTDSQPSVNARKSLIEQLDEALSVPYKIVAHRAAIRPTVKDRRPFIGFLPDFPQIGIFNGLGTKGASLAPYWAHHFVNHLTLGEKILPEVNIHRFF